MALWLIIFIFVMYRVALVFENYQNPIILINAILKQGPTAWFLLIFLTSLIVFPALLFSNIIRNIAKQNQIYIGKVWYVILSIVFTIVIYFLIGGLLESIKSA